MKLTNSSSIRRQPAGFTLLEMVIVLGIIAMILGGAIFSMKKIGNSAKLSQVNGDFSSIGTSLDMYKLTGGTLPSTQQGLQALVDKPTSTPVPRRWAQIYDKVPLDPWGVPYKYRFPGKKRATDYEIYTSGPDGMDNTADDLSSQDE